MENALLIYTPLASTHDNLLEAMRLSYRAYLFDNSLNMKLVAEMTPDKTLNPTGETIPIWVKEYVLDKLNPNSQ